LQSSGFGGGSERRAGGVSPLSDRPDRGLTPPARPGPHARSPWPAAEARSEMRRPSRNRGGSAPGGAAVPPARRHRRPDAPTTPSPRRPGRGGPPDPGPGRPPTGRDRTKGGGAPRKGTRSVPMCAAAGGAARPREHPPPQGSGPPGPRPIGRISDRASSASRSRGADPIRARRGLRPRVRNPSVRRSHPTRQRGSRPCPYAGASADSRCRRDSILGLWFSQGSLITPPDPLIRSTLPARGRLRRSALTRVAGDASEEVSS
jgi:hypothetical protein